MPQLSLFGQSVLEGSEKPKKCPKISNVELGVQPEQEATATVVATQSDIDNEACALTDDKSPRCVKCGKRATVYSQRGTGYCLEHSTCRCGESVEYFVPWDIGGTQWYVCPCVVQVDRALKVLQERLDREKAERRRRLLA